MLRYVLVLAVGVATGGVFTSLFLKQSNNTSNEQFIPVVDVPKASSVNVSEIEERLIRLESLLFTLQNQNRQCVDYLATLAVKPSISDFTDKLQTPTVKNNSNREYEEYQAVVNDQLAVGVWGTKQRNELAEALPKLTEEQQRSVLTQIVQAQNSGELRPGVDQN